MLKLLREFLEKQPRMKARDIARHFGEDHTSINQILYKNSNIFYKDDAHFWSLQTPREIRVEFPAGKWLDAADFEKSLLNAFSTWHPDCESVAFILPKECKPMLEALARLLALCNQLVDSKRRVTLDLRESAGVLTYLDRLGFFDFLAAPVAVLPKRPLEKRSQVYRGKNDGVIEFREIDVAKRDDDIPSLLRQCFVKFAGKDYDAAVTTILGELYDNVLLHSKATLPGFAGLQAYKTTNHVQTVISDNGLGIVGTLTPIIRKRYPEVQKIIEKSTYPADIALLIEVFSKGKISQLEKGHGTGLKRSGELGQKYRARISVRQRDFELRINQSSNGAAFTYEQGLRLLSGTHICFDFFLTRAK